MIQTLKNHLQKFHQANLWLELAHIREDKKQQIQMPNPSETVFTLDKGIVYPTVVFSKEDKGHNIEEKSKIQEVYEELAQQVKWSNGYMVNNLAI